MQLRGKTILFLGSSVTWGDNGTSFVEFLEQDYGIHCIKEAVSGTTLVDINQRSYISRLKTVDTKRPVDFFICQLSTNDATKDLPLEDIREAICFIVSYVRQHFGCPVAFYTGTYYESENYAKMVAMLQQTAKALDFAIIDLYNDPQMRSIRPEVYAKYMRDPIHPNITGYEKWWTPKFAAFLEQYPEAHERG